MTGFYRQLSRYSSAFALCADMALLTLGGKLKRKEMLSARFGDILSELYLLSAVLKRWHDEGRQQADLARRRMVHGDRLPHHRAAVCGHPGEPAEPLRRDHAQIHDPAVRRAGARASRHGHACLRATGVGAFRRARSPDVRACRMWMMTMAPARLEKAFLLVTAAEDVFKRMRAARLRDADAAVKQGVVTQVEAEQVQGSARGGGPGHRGRRLRAGGIVADLQEGRQRASVRAGAERDEGGRLMARPVYIIDGSRTPFLKARSGPGPFTPVDLAVQCGRPLLARQPFAPDAFDQVILGCVNVIADEMNPARVAALRLGMGEAMVAFTVQINCGSGMQSIDTGYRYIRDGNANLILTGGAEALSHAPLVWPQQGVRWFAGVAGAKGISRKSRRSPKRGRPISSRSSGLSAG